MRMSCSGCRVLRKGCSEDCTIRPCLQWIKNPESQSNATVFLAKFYGRAGLMNLINAGPDHLRPATFKSLLYEACGRIVNPIYGSVGLIWSGNWQLCQNAVDAVLRGNPITQIAADAAETSNGPPLKAYDIRHVTKDETSAVPLHRVRYRCRFKRSVGKTKSIPIWAGSGDESGHDEFNRSASHDSSLSDQSEMAPNVEGESRETESLAYMKTADPEFSPMQTSIKGAENGEIELELTLGFEPMLRSRSVNTKRRDLSGGDDGVRKMELGL